MSARRRPATASGDGVGPMATKALGIDVGGTGVKAAVVDLSDASLASERIRRKTPHPATPDAVIDTICEVVAAIGDAVAPGIPAGCGLPGVVKSGTLRTAANIDKAWIDYPVEATLRERLGRPVLALNDADAAGIAESVYGAAKGVPGSVLLLTIGTGIGTALLVGGTLVPNTELGHLVLNGRDAESQLSGEAVKRRGLSWKRWAREFNDFLAVLESHLWPDLIVIGGGVSKEFDAFAPYLKARAEVRPAAFRNLAGIIGSARAGAAAANGVPSQPAAAAVAERSRHGE